MSTNVTNSFEKFLHSHDDEAWSAALTDLLRSIHEVDRNATQIWFKFYPLNLWQALDRAKDATALSKYLLMQGHYQLADQIDSSHKFLYGHRYWSEVKSAVEAHAASFQTSPETTLADEIRKVAGLVAKQIKKDEALLPGITAVAFMTVLQTGLAAFKAAPGTIGLDKKSLRKDAAAVLQNRAKDDSQGLFGFLKTVDKDWSVTYDENDSRAHFNLINDEEIASAAARDQSQDWRAADSRCIEGPIPVECRSASCGTCWVGVIGGAEKLSDVTAREGKKIKEFGYIDTNEPKPIIRLACMARATGAVSIVIPPWNGVFGKYLTTPAAPETATLANVEEQVSSNGVAN